MELTTKHKLEKLIEYVGLGSVGFEIVEHGPFALIPLANRVLIICDTMIAFDRWELERQVLELSDKPDEIILMSARAFLAFVSTGYMYTGFQDGMGFAIKLPKLYTDGFLGLNKRVPNYNAIDRALQYAGFSANQDLFQYINRE